MSISIRKLAILMLAFGMSCSFQPRVQADPDSELVLPSSELQTGMDPAGEGNQTGILEQSRSIGKAIPSYKIQPGDELLVGFPDMPDQKFQASVRPDGFITSPLYGDILAAGMTPMELASDVEKMYQTGYFTARAVVTVSKMQEQAIYVFGAVKSPGKVNLSGPMDLLSAITVAGGATAAAEVRNIVVVRVEENGAYTFQEKDVSTMFENKGKSYPIWLQANDIVIVPNTLIGDIKVWVDQYIQTFIPPIDTFLRGRYYWFLAKQANQE